MVYTMCTQIVIMEYQLLFVLSLFVVLFLSYLIFSLANCVLNFFEASKISS